MRFRTLSLAMALARRAARRSGATLPGALYRRRRRLQSARSTSTCATQPRAARQAHESDDRRSASSDWRASGYGLGNGMRFEIEGNYRQGNIVHGTADPARHRRERHAADLWCHGQRAVRHGYRRALALPLCRRRRRLCLDASAQRHPGGPSPARSARSPSNEHEGSFAFQAIGGLSFPMPSVPGLSLTTEYRFFGVLANETYAGAITHAGACFPDEAEAAVQPQLPARRPLRLQCRAAGTRWRPTAPVPAAAAARSYLVFFDWDKATLTDRARQIVKEAADNSTRVQYTRIEVNGYTDTSGTQQYNQGLSVRRARAVQAELVKDGVPARRHHHPGLRRYASAGADRAGRARAAEPAGRDHHPLKESADGGAASRRHGSSAPSWPRYCSWPDARRRRLSRRRRKRRLRSRSHRPHRYRRAPSQPLRTTWTFRAGEEECVATAAGAGASAVVSAQRDSPIRLLVSLPATPVPPAPANTAVRFAGPAGSWQATARAAGRQFTVALGSDETALSRILVLLSGGVLDLGDQGKPVASLTVSPSDTEGQKWFDCARAKVL